MKPQSPWQTLGKPLGKPWANPGQTPPFFGQTPPGPSLRGPICVGKRSLWALMGMRPSASFYNTKEGKQLGSKKKTARFKKKERTYF